MNDRPKLVLGIDASRFITDEVVQFQLGLRDAGWVLCGRGLDVDETDVPTLLERFNPRVVLLQDRREWDARPGAGRTPGNWRNPADRFKRWGVLKDRHDILRLSVLKDIQNSGWHQDLEIQAGLDGWVHYYHVYYIVGKAPWIRTDRLVGTTHTIDAEKVPTFAEQRAGCLLSGYVGKSCANIYPLRVELFNRWQELPETTKLGHPGYGELGNHSDNFLNILNRYKVAICTASAFDLFLRKIVEASACGCIVVTNLSTKECTHIIERNLIRVRPDDWFDGVKEAVQKGLDCWNLSRQREVAKEVKQWYDWRTTGQRLNADIEEFGRRIGK